MNRLVITEKDFTRTKKQLKRVLQEEGFEITLSKSGQLLLKTFGYKNEHEFQNSLPLNKNIKNSLFKENKIVEFYFLELLSLYKRIDYVLTSKLHFKNNNTFQFDMLIECKSRVSMFVKGFEAQKENIITGEKACYSILNNCARFVYNILMEINYNDNYNFLDKEELLIVKHLYNYHNIEIWMLRDKNYRKESFLKLVDFELELSNENIQKKGNIFSAVNSIALEIFEPETGTLYTRTFGDVGMSQKSVGFEHKDNSYIELHGSWTEKRKLIKII